MILIALLIISGAILLYLLFTPLSFSLDLDFDERLTATSSLSLFPFRYQLYPAKPGVNEKPRKRPIQAVKKPRLSRLQKPDIALLLDVGASLFRFLGKALKAPNRFYLNADIVGGSPEPDITGELYGAYHAIRPNLPESICITYAPDYLAERLGCKISCGLAVRPISLLREFLIFMFRLPIIRIIKLYRRLMK